MSDLNTIFVSLKACLLSTKSGIPLNQLENDYFKLNGERINFRSLGFPSLEAMLNSSDKFIIQHFGGDTIVKAKTSDKTQHLTDLIKRQKSKPPKKKLFIGHKAAPPKFNISSTYNRPYSKQGNVDSSYGAPRNYQNGSNYTNTHKKSATYNNRPNQYNNYLPKSNGNTFNTPLPLMDNNRHNTNSYHENDESNSDKCLPETKAFQQSNLFSDDSNNYVKLTPHTNGTHSLITNGKSNTKLEHTFPNTSSCSSLESTNSSNSTNYSPMSKLKNHSDQIQIGSNVNNITSQMVNKYHKHMISNSNIYMQEKNSESFNPSTQPHTSISKFPSIQNMSIKPSTAQSRLDRYPKKCEEPPSMKVGVTEKPLQIEQSHFQIETEDSFTEVIEDKDYIDELESYLKNLNLSEPYYECMVKKEKSGRTIKLTHICSIKINERIVGSSFPVECSTVDYAKNVAAKHALTALKKQYGENVVYPITNDINVMASRIKELLKLGYEETGLMGDVLERMYREKCQENLPDNWVQLLEVYSYFTFDKLVEDKIIIYLNNLENNLPNGHENENGYLETSVEEQSIVPGTPLMFEDYEEKSVLVSANYGSTSVWIRFVGQSADENFIKMQAKFNDTMNSAGFSIVEEVVEGEFYAVLYNTSWHRVQISSPADDDGTVTCFMVDTGEQLTISKDQICYLEPVFMKTKTQAIECILTQLDNFGTFDGLKELLDEIILNKTFFLIPDSLEEGYTRVTLYEKGETSDRNNVNEVIIQRFLNKCVAKLPSFEENAVVDGNVSSIVESGHLYLQLKFDIVSSLEEILPNDECLLPEYFLKNKEDINKDQVYLIKYEEDEGSNIWCRAQVLEIINDTEVKIIFIDYGNNAKCEITRLANLDMFDPLMSKIPPQALKVSMNLIPPSVMTSDIAKKIYEIIGNDRVLVNLINVPANDVPYIQLYKTQPNSPDIPLCINIQLAQSLKK